MNDLRRLSVLVGLLGVMWSSPSLADVKMTVVPSLGAGAPPGAVSGAGLGATLPVS